MPSTDLHKHPGLQFGRKKLGQAWGYAPEYVIQTGFPHSSVGKESTFNAEDPALIPGSGRSPGEGIGYHSSILRLPLWLKL